MFLGDEGFVIVETDMGNSDKLAPPLPLTLLGVKPLLLLMSFVLDYAKNLDVTCADYDTFASA